MANYIVVNCEPKCTRIAFDTKNTGILKNTISSMIKIHVLEQIFIYRQCTRISSETKSQIKLINTS